MRKDKESQKRQILRHMELRGRISQWIATQEYHILRLGARIWDLRKDGYDIRDEMVYTTDEHGEHTHWKEYWLAPQ